MNALHTLLRLKQIEDETTREPLEIDRSVALHKERAELLANVGNPPLELLGSLDALKWAEAFAACIPDVSVSHAYGWFTSAMSAAHVAGVRQGEESRTLPQRVANMEAALTLIQIELRAGRIKSAGDYRDANDERLTLANIVDKALAP